MNTTYYKLELIPHRFAQSKQNNLEQALNNEWPWINEPYNDNLMNKLRSLLPENNSDNWDDDVEEYASNLDWGSDIRIYKNIDNQDKVEGISFRYSPLDDKLDILEQFVQLADEENCLIYAEESKILFEPHMDLLLEDLEKYQVMRFDSNLICA